MRSFVNRLSRESSPYLLLHAENPVDWYAWGEEAFEAARSADKPIFLSVGYSTCYWCHVMERECFSDPGIARALNDGFVSVKLDREERPDIDEIYMAATQLLSGSGGWPNSLFLTHDLKPFFAGTYFPPEDRMGRPGFPRVLAALRQAWALRRADVLDQAEAVAEAIRRHLQAGSSGPPVLGAATAEEARDLLSRRFDQESGGFGDAPKFPSPANLFFLLDLALEGDSEAREMLVSTLDHMARGGIHDQLGGGFHRYSTDSLWLVPHFEKMLYDNAALATLYALAAPLALEAGFARVARMTLDFVLREMTDGAGAFLSAIDAETDGHEGAYSTWTKDELLKVLDGAQVPLLASVFGFDGPPNFEGDRYVLYLPLPLLEQAAKAGLPLEALLERIEPGRQALFAARGTRKRPLTDDKVLTDWNGLMVGAMARAGRFLAETRYVAAGKSAARFILTHLRDRSGVLLHSYRAGTSKVPALLDDYAFLIDGLLALYDASGEDVWLEEARRLQSEQDERLWDKEGGYFEAAESRDLLARSKPGHDGALASGNGVSALNLLEFARHSPGGPEGERLDRLLGFFSPAVSESPLGHLTLLRASHRRATGAPAVQKPAPEAARHDLPRAPMEEEAQGVVEVQGRLGSGEGPWRPFVLNLKIREGWHVNSNRPVLRFLVPTSVNAVSGKLRDVRYPEGERYEGTLAIEGQVEVVEGAPVVVGLSFQPCDEDRCLAKVAREVVLA